MRSICIGLLCYFLPVAVQAQYNLPSCYGNQVNLKARPFSLGLKQAGLGFGSFGNYSGIDLSVSNLTCQTNGLSLSLWEKRTSTDQSRINGLALGVLTEEKQVNGINVAVLAGSSEITNGLNTGLICLGKHVNGASLGYFNDVDYLNGVDLSFLVDRGKISNGFDFAMGVRIDTVKGVAIGGLIDVTKKADGVFLSGLFCSSKVSRGISFAPINLIAKRGKGVQLGVYNKAYEFKGVQIGLVNVIEQNRKPFRTMPFLNFNFRKRSNHKPQEKDYFHQPGPPLVDHRDGNRYRTARIGEQVWMAENLNYRDSLLTPMCYSRFFPSYCEKYGTIYDGVVLNQVCPSGWHLPSQEEYQVLLSTVGIDARAAFIALQNGGASGFNGWPSQENDDVVKCWTSSSKKRYQQTVFMLNNYLEKSMFDRSASQRNYHFVRCIKD